MTIYEEALLKWGKEGQIEQMKEEAIELSLALQKLRRSGDPEKKLLAVIDELADVEIMLEEMKLVFPYALVEERKKFKLDRLRRRLDGLEDL